ncbi:MAG TPA: hypothetical protein VK181_11225 [Rhizobium sp.]|nr:hypothetical protein [Rhizobium sp.]
MIMDEFLEIADNLSVAAAAGTAVLADAIDLDALGQRIGTGEPTLYLVLSVSEAFVGVGATVQFRLVSDSTDPASTDGTESRHWQSPAIAVASLTVGQKMIVPLPSGFPTYERYLQLQVVTAGATTTAGRINAFLTPFPDDWRAMPEANS